MKARAAWRRVEIGQDNSRYWSHGDYDGCRQLDRSVLCLAENLAMRLLAESLPSRIAESGDEVDLIITDVVMPKLDGPSLVRRVREQSDAMKVIFISGYTEDSFRKSLGEDEQIHFLPKPFSLKELVVKVKEVLEA